VDTHPRPTWGEPMAARGEFWWPHLGTFSGRLRGVSHDRRHSGMNGARRKIRRMLADPKIGTLVVEHRDRLGRMNVELVEAALSASGRRLVVLEEGEVDDDLVRDMVEVPTSFCARLYGRRSARNRAERALRCAAHDVGPMAVLHPRESIDP